MDEKLAMLRIHRSTRGLDDEQLEVLAQNAEVVHCQVGDIVHRLDDPAGRLLLVVSGKLTMTAASNLGVKTVIRQIGRDDQFGLLMLESEAPVPIELTAEHNTTLLRFDKEDAIRLVIELPLWRRNMMGNLTPQILDTILKTTQRESRRVVAFVHLSEESRKLTRTLLARMSELGEQVALLSDRPPANEDHVWNFKSLLDETNRLRTLDEIRDHVSHWQDADRVFLEATLETAQRFMQPLGDSADAVFWLCSDATVDVATQALQSMVTCSPAKQDKMFVVWMLAEGKQAAPLTPQLDALCRRDFKLHWHGDPQSPTCSRRAGIERIVHHLRGVSVGLALGGGAARGMAHLGVLQVLEEADIVIDRMSGTSAGALTGVLYAAGYSADFQIAAFARDLTPPRYFRWLPYGDGWYILNKYRGGHWDGMLRRYLSDWRLEQLAIPFSSVATDLVGAKQVIRDSGDAAQAIVESINLPGLSRPICKDGMALVDGGVLNVMPADVLVAQHANFVIASDVSARIRFEFSGNSPETPTEQMKVPHSIHTLVRMRTVQDRNLRSVGGSSADIIIEPDVSQVELTDFKRAAKIAAYGRAAGVEMLPEIRRALHALDESLFPIV